MPNLLSQTDHIIGFSSPIFASEWRYGRFYLCPTTQATTASTERDCKPIMEVWRVFWIEHLKESDVDRIYWKSLSSTFCSFLDFNCLHGLIEKLLEVMVSASLIARLIIARVSRSRLSLWVSSTGSSALIGGCITVFTECAWDVVLIVFNVFIFSILQKLMIEPGGYLVGSMALLCTKLVKKQTPSYWGAAVLL